MDDCGLASVFLAGHNRNPAAVALRLDSTEVTYGALHSLALRFAGGLPPPRDRAQPRVGIMSGSQSLITYVGILAVVYAGAALVPLDPREPVEQIAQRVEAAGLKSVIADEAGAELLNAADAKRPVDLVGNPVRPLLRPRQVDEDQVAYLTFGSRPDGRPHGVPVSYSNMRHLLVCSRQAHPLGADDVLAQSFEPTLDPFLYSLFLTWGAGGTLVPAPDPRLEELPSLLRRHGVTVWSSTPNSVRLLRTLGLLAPGSLPTLTRSMFSGQAMTAAEARDWVSAAPSTVLDTLYGAPELTGICSTRRWDPQAAVGSDDQVPIGRVHDGLQAWVLNDDQAESDEGELCVAGPQTVGGYLDPAHDEGRFLYLHGARWFRTGDRVRRLPDGEFSRLGRVDRQVQICGRPVDPAMIERTMTGLHGVADCAVVPVDQSGDSVLGAVFTGDPAVADKLPRQLLGRLPAHLVPSRIEHRTELPYRADGQVDRNAVAHRLPGLQGL